MKNLHIKILLISLAVCLGGCSDDDKIITPPANYHFFENAVGLYYGEKYGSHTGYYELKLLNGSLDQGYNLAGDGKVITLCFFSDVTSSAAIELVGGEYTPGDESGNKRTFLPGAPSGGTTLLRQRSGGFETTYITGGSFRIAASETYTVTFTFTDSEGAELKGTFEGPISVHNLSGDGSGEPETPGEGDGESNENDGE